MNFNEKVNIRTNQWYVSCFYDSNWSESFNWYSVRVMLVTKVQMVTSRNETRIPFTDSTENI